MKRKVDPSPGFDSTQIRPPCRSTILAQVARPRPVPGNSSPSCNRRKAAKFSSAVRILSFYSAAGSSLQVDDKSDSAYHEKEEVRPSGILSGKEIKAPASAEKPK